MQVLLIFTLMLTNIDCHELDRLNFFDVIAANLSMNSQWLNFIQSVGTDYKDWMYRANGLLINDTLQTESNSCLSDIAYITTALIRGEPWPLKFLDSSARFPAGISGGDLTWIGSYEMCNSIEKPAYNISGRYCNIRLPVRMDDPDIVIDIGITIGLCLPSNCGTKNLQNIARRIFRTVSVDVDDRYTFCHMKFNELPNDSYFTSAVIVLTVILAAVLIGTVVDTMLYVKWKRSCQYIPVGSWNTFISFNRPNRWMSQDSEDGEDPEESVANSHNREPSVHSIKEFEEYREGFFHRYLLCGGFFLVFSFPYNIHKLWQSQPPVLKDESGNTERHPLISLEGIRVISLAWIIYVHSFTYQTYYADNMLLVRDSFYQKWSFQLVRNGSFSVDTFFLISGLLTCYLLLPTENKMKGCRRKTRFWANFIIHRFLRMAPAWFVITIAFTGLFPYATDGPVYPQNAISNDELEGCRDHWWVTFLNNWLYLKRPCMLWTWYLSNDFQFSAVLAPIFVTLASLHWIAGVVFGVALVISGAVATFVITYVYEYGPSPIPLASYEHLYAVPYARWGPYAIGMLLGLVIRKWPVSVQNMSTCKRYCISISGSLFAAFITLIVLFGIYPQLSGKQPPLNDITASIYAAFSRPLWAIGIAIAIYLCASNLSPLVNAILGFRGFTLLSRLNYCAYILHPIVIMYFHQSSKRTRSLDPTYLMFTFASVWLLSYLVSVVFTVSTETPVMSFEKFCRRKRPTGTTPTND